MSLDRTLLTRSPAKMTIGGGVFYPRAAIKIPLKPDFEDIANALHGRVNRYKKDYIIRFPISVFGLWQSLGVLFPAALLNNTPGVSLCSDAACVIHAKNNDILTFHNAFVSKMPNLFLGIDAEIFAADLEITALIKGGANPEDAAAYYTRSTSAYTETAFSLSTFKRQRYSLAWVGTGLTSFEMHKGINIEWDGEVKYIVSSNYGTCDAFMGENTFCAKVSGIPIGPTRAQVEAATRGQGVILGALANPTAASTNDLTITGSGVSIVAKNVHIEEDGDTFDITELRQSPVTFKTTTGIAAGAVAVAATVS